MAFPDNHDLCFDKADFEKDDFTVDNFLDNQGTNFETLRDDLGRYLKDLRSAMIELINQDYSDFVNLSSNLIGLDKSILKLRVPLCQFKEEILQVKCSLDEGIEELTLQLDTREELMTTRESLKNLRTLLDLMDKMEILLKFKEDANLARISAQLSQSGVCINNCSMISSELAEKHQRLEKEFFALLDQLLLRLLSSDKMGFSNELKASTRECLKIYASLDKFSHVEEFVRKHWVVPALKPLMSEQSAKSVSDLYSKILLILSEKNSAINLLIQLTQECEEVKKFDFLMKSYWPEVCESLMKIHSLFAPGHPNEFYLKYTETVKFLDKFEMQLKSRQRVDEFRAREDYSKFTKKWNLIVYYQIRFQEIAGTLEKALVESKQFDKSESGSIFELNVINIAWGCVNQCFSAGTFLPQLIHKFWKLTLQLLSRTHSWALDVTSKNEKGDFLSILYADLKLLCTKIMDTLKLVEAAFPLTTALSESLTDNLKECRANYESVLVSVIDKIVDISNSKDNISKSVTDIPRIYRRTNRGIPSSAGPYMDKFLKAVHEINSSPVFKAKFNEKERQTIILRMVKNVSQVYLVAVQELLMSVQKTEDSLRKLKQIRDKNTTSGQSSASGGQSVSDDDKIRLQIQQDLKHFASEVNKLGLQDVDVPDIKELHAVVEKSLSTSK